jgi:toxoflavin biosynthesis protein ToxD
MTKPSLLPPSNDANRRPRVVPMLLAGLICTLIASGVGFGLWYMRDYRGESARKAEETRPIIDINDPGIFIQTGGEPVSIIDPSVSIAVAKEVKIPGGEVIIGEETAQPHKVKLQPFAIAETEVTNEQYAQFIKDTKYRTPDHWINGTYPANSGNRPVTNITWADAVAYCDWLSKRLGVTVRLPTEAEWELAARGLEGLRYPWGNEWDDQAVASAESDGMVSSVKSYPKGSSPFNVYDMAGNVWEWTLDSVPKNDKSADVDSAKLIITKGGAADEPKDLISATSRREVLANGSSDTLGFRYVIIRNSQDITSSNIADANIKKDKSYFKER